MLPRRSAMSVIVFLVPPLVLYGVAVLLPILQSLVLSLFSWDGITDMVFVGFDNYIKMFTRRRRLLDRVPQRARLPRDLPRATAGRRARRRGPADGAPSQRVSS